jgi:hypothetical protein
MLIYPFSSVKSVARFLFVALWSKTAAPGASGPPFALFSAFCKIVVVPRSFTHWKETRKEPP